MLSSGSKSSKEEEKTESGIKDRLKKQIDRSILLLTEPNKLRDDNESLWPDDLMTLILYLKNVRRHQKGLDLFHTFSGVYDVSKTLNYSGLNDPDITELIKFLSANVHQLPNGFRFSIFAKINQHWTLVEHEVNDGVLNVFNLDSALTDSGPLFFNAYKKMLAEQNILGHVFEYGPEPELLFGNKSAQKKVDDNKIQQDRYRCAVYVLDQESALSRMDVFRLLLRKVDRFFQRTETPNEMSHIFRLTTSRKFINSLNKTQKNIVINEKGQTLSNLLPKNTQKELEEFKSAPIRKGKKILEITKLQLEQLSEQEIAAIFNRNLITDLKTISDFYSKPVNTLINLLVKSVQQKEPSEAAFIFQKELQQTIFRKESDEKKLQHLMDLTSQYFQSTKDKDYKLFATAAVYNIFHIQNFNELVHVYKSMMADSAMQQLQNHTFSLYKIVYNPELSDIKEAFKIQFLKFAFESKAVLDTIIGDPKLLEFLNESRFIVKDKTSSVQALEKLQHNFSDPKLKEQELAKLTKHEDKLNQKYHFSDDTKSDLRINPKFE